MRSSLIISAFVLVAAGCTSASSTTDGSPSLGEAGFGAAIPGPSQPLATTTADDWVVSLLGERSLSTGLNWLGVAVDGPVSGLTTVWRPRMIMAGGMQHGAPLLPELAADVPQGSVGVVFPMASSTADIWSMTVDLRAGDGTAKTAVFDNLAVTDGRNTRVIALSAGTIDAGAGKNRLVASLSLEAPPRVGLNPVTITLHQTLDMTTFVPVENATIELDPEMPTMGHGAPGSLSPTPVAPGRYRGQVSLSMSGDWEVTATVRVAGALLAEPTFTVAF